MIEEWNLLQTNLGRIRQRKYEVALIPVGATEAHNLHLPEGQDILQALSIAERACRKAWQITPSILCLPGIPYGVDCNLAAFPFSIHVSQNTLDQLLGDIVFSLNQHGIRKVVLLNSHGGNDFIPFVREIQSECDSHVFLCDWWKMALDHYDQIFTHPDNHAGEMETSVGLALHPQWIEMDQARDGYAKPFLFEALERGWIKTSRDFSRLNDHCAVGYPGEATAAKGEQYLEIVVERLSSFLIELARAPITSDFPHKKDKGALGQK